MVKILAFSGSARNDSYNQRLVTQAAGMMSQYSDVAVTTINLRNYPMPVFNQDDEQSDGLPESARGFKSLLLEHDAWLIASPEYNGSFSALLKNALDWASRSEVDDEPSLSAYRGKFAAIMSASPGGLGGIRGLVPLRLLLGNLGVTVIAEQFALKFAAKAFDNDGTLIEESQQKQLQRVVARLRFIASAVSNAST